MVQQVTTKPTPRQRENADGVYFVIHASFSKSNAVRVYGPEAEVPAWTGNHMPDEVTRELSQRMHFAAWRMSRSKDEKSKGFWKAHYLHMRDLVVMGNRKLIFRAIRRWMPPATHAEDMTSDCHIVLIQSVAAYNPWMGIRFSTYAFTCLMRALSRLSLKMQADRMNRSVPLESLAGTQLDPFSLDNQDGAGFKLDEVLGDQSAVLSPREKLVLIQRFCLNDKQKTGTLEQVGKNLGLSKERVRQVQARALDKLRAVLA
jgi:RNA polymerase sigma factor (sigma-70 family)